MSVDLESGHFTRGAPPHGTRLVMIRHGEARCNADAVIGGPRGDGGLTDRGRAQARALLERLRATGELAAASALYTSVLDRSIETAEILRPGLGSLEATPDCDLCELHPGEADALTWAEYVERFGAPDYERRPTAPFAPGGESWLGFYQRVTRRLEELAVHHRGELVVMVVHGGLIEQAMKAVTHDAPQVRLGLRTEHCSITEIEFDAGRRRLLRYNDVAPLSS